MPLVDSGDNQFDDKCRAQYPHEIVPVKFLFYIYADTAHFPMELIIIEQGKKYAHKRPHNSQHLYTTSQFLKIHSSYPFCFL